MTAPQRRAAVRLTVVVGEEDRHHGRPLATELVHRAHAAGLAGASVYRGCEGFGAGRRVHTSRLLSLAEDLPLSVVVVDAAERVEAFLPLVGELLDAAGAGGLVTVEDVTVVRYGNGTVDGAMDGAIDGAIDGDAAGSPG